MHHDVTCKNCANTANMPSCISSDKFSELELIVEGQPHTPGCDHSLVEQFVNLELLHGHLVMSAVILNSVGSISDGTCLAKAISWLSLLPTPQAPPLGVHLINPELQLLFIHYFNK